MVSSQMQIYPEVYKTQKCFLEKRAVVRIICSENMKLFHFCGIIFLCKSYTCLVYVREVIQSC